MIRTLCIAPVTEKVCPVLRMLLLASFLMVLLFGTGLEAQTPISTVDTSLVGSQKYTLRVGGKPFFPIGIQARFDKVRYDDGYLFTMANCNTLAAQAAAAGFNYLIVPITWMEVEPVQNQFNWTVLEDYLAIANANNLKLELLWEGVNDDGVVGGMTDASFPGEADTGTPAGYSLRVPPYVLYSPSAGSTATTSNYEIVSGEPYEMNLSDTNLQARESYVLGQVANHIAVWDAANGNLHPVIGFQIENEPQKFSDPVTIDYISAVGMGVKNSNYSVWTRSNTIDSASTVISRANVNQSLRTSTGTGLDFVGIDNYSNTPSVIASASPLVTGNYSEIMENGGANSGTVKLAALSGNTALSTYDLCGPDMHGLWQLSSPGACTTTGSNFPLVVLVNHLFASDTVDLALNAQGNGLFVHNNTASSVSPTTGGFLGVTYTPVSTTDQGISIHRSDSELILMSTGGGTFTYPSSFQVTSATQGYFDANNVWVPQGNNAFTSTSTTVTAGATVRLTYTLPAPTTPTGLTLVALGSAQVQLQWTGSTYAASYNVKRSTVSGGPYTTVATGLTGTSYLDTGLTNGTTYYYVVTAVNSTAESANSNEVRAMPNASSVVVQYGSTNLVYPGSTQVTACVPASNDVTPTGMVQILDGSTVLTTLTLGTSGCASWYINPGLAVGTHQLSAVYMGNSAYPGEVSAPTTITVTAATRPVVFTPNNYNFGTVKVGSSASEVFTFTNTDTSSHTITAIKLGTDSTNSYSMTSTCAGTINKESSCTVTVTFAPSVATSISNTLTQTGGGGTAIASLTGTGVINSNVVVAHSDATVAIYPTSLATQAVTSPGGGVGIAIDSAGSIISIDKGGASATKLSNTGASMGSLYDPGLSGATALAVDGLSNVWITNSGGSVSVFNSSGTVVGSGPIGTAANLSQPASVNVDSAGSLWIANSGNNTVTEIIGVAAPAAPLVQQVVNTAPGVRP